MSEITKALVRFQRAAPIVVKNKHVSAGAKQYRYADLAEVITTIRGALADAGLAFSQSIENNGSTTLVTHLYHEGGESIESRMPLPIEQLQPQAVGSLLSYYRRYSLTSLLGVVIDDEDDDGQKAQDAGATHNSPLKQQLKASVAAENSKKNYDTLALQEHFNDPKFHTLTGEDGKIIDLFKKTPEGLAWKRTACKDAVEPLFNDLDAAGDLSELRAVLHSAENKIRLEICKIAVPLWASEFERRFKNREKDLSTETDDPSRYLRA